MKYAYPPDVLQFVQRSLETGDYASEDEVVVAGMRALRDIKQRQQSLRDDIQAALAEIDAGLVLQRLFPLSTSHHKFGAPALFVACLCDTVSFHPPIAPRHDLVLVPATQID